MSWIHRTDRHIGGNIYLSASSLLNPRYRNRALVVASMVNRSIDVFRKYLDFPEDIKIRIAPIKGKNNGTCHQNGVIVLRCTLAWDLALEVFAHELVHAEQYKQGRLKTNWVYGKGYVTSWNGDRVNNKGTTYKSYREQPWEQEAWGRQYELAEKVHQELEQMYA